MTPTADAALATCLLPAMRAGGTLSIDEPISPRLLRTQREYQAIQRVWSARWPFDIPPLAEVELRAPARAPDPAAPGRGVAAFFSGGVDSWSTVLDNPDLTQLVFVRGMDLALDGPELADEVEARLREAAAAIDRPLVVVETNLRALSDPLIPWELYFGAALAAVALLLAPLFERVAIAGDSDYEAMVDQGANPLVDHLWSSESLELVHDGGRYSRVERIARIADHPVVQDTLRVCWENRGGAYNCGQCRKCLLTMVTLEALGARQRFETFPPPLDLDALARIEIAQPVLLTLWQDVLDVVRERDRRDLEPAVEGVVARGKQRLGLPPSYRMRQAGREPEQPAPDPLEVVLNSRSWKLTRPLRALASWARRPRRRSRRAAP